MPNSLTDGSDIIEEVAVESVFYSSVFEEGVQDHNSLAIKGVAAISPD